LTKPELMEQWLMKTNFKPIEGYKFQITFSPKPDSKYQGTVYWEVLEIKPFSKLSYSWNGTTKDKKNFNSIVVWTLIPIENGTELQIQHNGFTVIEDILNHTAGWKACLKRFEELINSIKK